MKITHRVPPQAFQSATLDPDYAADVEKATHRAEVAFARSLQRARAAVERAEASVMRQARQATTRKRRVDLRLAQELYAERMRELEVLQALAQTHGAPARNRGTKSFRPVPAPKAL